MKLVVAISGASGVVYGIRVLEELKKKNVETHLIVSRLGRQVIGMETDNTIEYVDSLATYCYTEHDFAVPIASGSFRCDGMMIVPCSMKTLAGISSGYADTVLLRAADVMIKEGRRLLLVVRETPLSSIHLDNMLKLSKIGVTIFPPLPAFYVKQETIEDLIRNTVGRILDQFGIQVEGFVRWGPV